MLAHAVYFTLRDPTPEAARRLVDSCRLHLTGHPGTLAFSVGVRSDYDRQVNDREYHVGLEIVFDSHESHDTYQQAERHHRFIAENADTWEKVRVFDTDLAAFEKT